MTFVDFDILTLRETSVVCDWGISWGFMFRLEGTWRLGCDVLQAGNRRDPRFIRPVSSYRLHAGQRFDTENVE